MPLDSNSSYPVDITLLLRAYAEQRWLTVELLPVLEELESPGDVPEEQIGAALAYLEVLWIDARKLAAATEAALARLLAEDPRGHSALDDRARSYHAHVTRQRRAVAERMQWATGCFAQQDLHATF